jgi:hypothetical protein
MLSRSDRWLRFRTASSEGGRPRSRRSWASIRGRCGVLMVYTAAAGLFRDRVTAALPLVSSFFLAKATFPFRVPFS